ncbi:MAG: long-chain fatty acid--CoA ligase [Alphaproteobacteria bacterium]|nr:long-chain fatty acid--CoA ligase [Alphaproteobacteria bacterium]MBU1514322.1 long-chain fatty acid--CoA ligase [Alphaproteobacteria bacterium]MBU2095966.1 long-chain fatty acid--CoA ligase [Alphaproteobacteria bacterium]MBU2153064.1 long-chain fatty acid--CoA ligase [Alphaproteobacteria bacterium]MBU2308521.1 long-chain fatty acid--CoA ligase [Alphaproteobacteria bacterium]
MHTALLLDMAADAAPDRLALGGLADGLTFEETRRRARAGAAWLARQGGQTVAFLGLNGWAMPVALFASGLLAEPFAPLNYRLPNADLNKLLARTAPSVAVVDDDMLHRLDTHAGVTVVARSAFEAACAAEAADDPPWAEPDIAVLLFTSGTTGEPKAAILRHANLTSYVIGTVEFLGADEGEAALVSVPPYHIAGISAVLTGVYGGRRIVYLEAFTPEAWVDAATREAITHAMVVPTMLGSILDILAERGESLPALRALSYGGGRMPLPVIERALELLPHVDFVNAYGLTETSSTIAVLGPDDHRMAIYSDDPAAKRRLGSVGKPLPALELEIRDPDGKALGPNQSGEIYVRGEQVSGEYTHKKVVQDDGWFATNDGGWMDDEGYLFVEGRLDDVIVRGGENISPGEIEDVLREHPNVADVAVLGVPDDHWGEKVAAAVVVKDGAPAADDLAAWVRERLRSTKTPEVWEFRDALPYNDTGKLLRRQLRTEMSAKPAAA